MEATELQFMESNHYYLERDSIHATTGWTRKRKNLCFPEFLKSLKTQAIYSILKWQKDAESEKRKLNKNIIEDENSCNPLRNYSTYMLNLH